MLKIGEFSRLSQVTVKTLHHYDDQGLLHPAHVDPVTSYRYYTVTQLPRIHRIMAFKEMGLSLEQIRLMLDEDVPIEQIRGMLRLKQAEIQHRVSEEQKRLSMIEFRLRMIEAETNFPEMDVVIKRVDPMRVLSIFVGWDQEMAPFVQEVQRAIQAGKLKFSGMAIDVFHGDEIIRLESPNLGDGQHEILLLVEESQTEDVTLENIGTLTLRQSPVIETAATLMLHGIKQEEGYERVVLLQRWAVAHGYRLPSLVRYVHHRGPLETLDRNEWVIEVQLAVETAE